MDAKIIFVILLLFSIELSNMSVRPKQATSKVWIYVYICTILSQYIFSN